MHTFKLIEKSQNLKIMTCDITMTVSVIMRTMSEYGLSVIKKVFPDYYQHILSI